MSKTKGTDKETIPNMPTLAIEPRKARISNKTGSPKMRSVSLESDQRLKRNVVDKKSKPCTTTNNPIKTKTSSAINQDKVSQNHRAN